MSVKKGVSEENRKFSSNREEGISSPITKANQCVL